MIHAKVKREHVYFISEGGVHDTIFGNLHDLDEVKIPEHAISLKIAEVCEKIKKNNGFYHHGSWIDWPVFTDKEPEQRLAKLVNNAGTYIARFFTNSRKSSSLTRREWTARYETTIVPHDGCERKADVVLVNNSDADAEEAPR